MNQRMMRFCLTGIVLLFMLIIFWFSAQPADDSTQMSHHVGKTVGRLLIPGFSKWPQDKQEDFAQKIDHPVRKAAHATEYAVLAILCYGMYFSYGYAGKRRSFLAFLLTVFYACTDEFHQFFVPGRSCQLIDVLIDSLGGMFGVLIVSLVFALISKKSS